MTLWCLHEDADSRTSSNLRIIDNFQGQSRESKIVREHCDQAVIHFYIPLSRISSTPFFRFNHLYHTWKRETETWSDSDLMCMHHAYQEIIGMGQAALSFIFRLLRSGEEEHWFWALKAITGADPVPEHHRGRVKFMTEDWLTWAHVNGHI